MTNLYCSCLAMPLATLLVAIILAFNGAPLWIWTATAAVFIGLTPGAFPWWWMAFGIAAAILNIPILRQYFMSWPVFKAMKALELMPAISETERVALRAGDVWIETELFSGKPSFNKLLKQNYPQLTAEEQAFMDGPVAELCKMTSDWDVWQRRDLPPEAWAYIKKHGFLGMIIPKEYGGLGFSALAQSEVLAILGSRSIPLCISVMVPNSLGPAELLLHYGTEEQKKHWLPRLARGEEIPCFGLTEPGAGSDAGSITSTGVVFKGKDGKLYIRLNWNKRWITLAAVSTVIGLAFKLKDPDNLLGTGKEDIGITCALIPSKTPGVKADRRHDPLGVPFYNCPTQGKDVELPIDAIIGGAPMAGHGWKMLMECLAAGRGISLPAQSTGGSKYIARITSAHATVRKQFGVSIGKFEGVMEPLARIGAWSYMLEAARRYTCGALDGGKKPPVVTAIAKYNFTELARKMVNDGMDILGGAGISRGPKNLLAHGYFAAPICITVEGANILTRTLIIFGQGALRAHPYAYREVDAIETGNLAAFDSAFWGHMGHVLRNAVRAVVLSLSRGWFCIPGAGGGVSKYYRRLAWASASFALMADIAMAGLGGKLKFKEKITGRFADILSWMYLATAVLRRYEAEGRRKEDLPFVRWSLDYAFLQIQQAFDGLFANFDVPVLGWILGGPIRWYASLNPIGSMPSDHLDLKIAALMQTPGEQRNRLFGGIYVGSGPNEQFGKLEEAFALAVASEDVAAKVRRAVKSKQLKKAPPAELYKNAVNEGVITQPEFDSIAAAEKARWDAIQVDDFGLKEYIDNKGPTPG